MNICSSLHVRRGKVGLWILALGLVGGLGGRGALPAEEKPSAPPAAQSQSAPEQHKVLRAGMIGLTTSHVIAFSGMINDPKAAGPMAQVEVVAGFPGDVQDNPASWDLSLIHI